MSMTLRLEDGGPIVLREDHYLAEGGQARVYAVGDQAFKIFEKPADVPTPEKLRELAAVTHRAPVLPHTRVFERRRGTGRGGRLRDALGPGRSASRPTHDRVVPSADRS